MTKLTKSSDINTYRCTKKDLNPQDSTRYSSMPDICICPAYRLCNY